MFVEKKGGLNEILDDSKRLFIEAWHQTIKARVTKLGWLNLLLK